MAVDARGTIDYVSPSVERLLRSPASALLGTPLTDLAHPEDVEALRSLISKAMSDPGGRVSGEWRIGQADGTWLPAETVASSGAGDPDTTGVVLNTRVEGDADPGAIPTRAPWLLPFRGVAELSDETRQGRYVAPVRAQGINQSRGHDDAVGAGFDEHLDVRGRADAKAHRDRHG